MFFFEDLKSHWILDDRPISTSRLFWELTHLTWGSNGKPDKKSADGADCLDCLIYGCSVLAKGRETSDKFAWMKGLSDADIIIRQAERRMDKMHRILEEGGL